MRLNALHPAVVVIQNEGEFIYAKDYPLYAFKVYSQDGETHLAVNVMSSDGTKKWVDLGADGGGGASLDKLIQEIADRKAADAAIRRDMTAAITAEAAAREADIANVNSATSHLVSRETENGASVYKTSEVPTLGMGASSDPIVLKSCLDWLETRIAECEDKLIPRYTINFYRYNGGDLLETRSVKQGSTVTAPAENPERQYYTFLGWSKSMPFTAVSDTDIYGTWEQTTFTVKFYDYSGGHVLKTEYVGKGQNATPPADPTREYFTFLGWSGSYTNVTSNRNIYGTWDVIPNLGTEWRGHAQATNPNTSDQRIKATIAKFPFTGGSMKDMQAYVNTTYPSAYDASSDTFTFSDAELEAMTERYLVPKGYSVIVGGDQNTPDKNVTFAIVMTKDSTYTYNVWSPDAGDYIPGSTDNIYSVEGTDYIFILKDVETQAKIVVS